MKKHLRLLKNWDFQKLLNKKQQVINKEYVIYFQPNNLKHVRIGISASKKLGNAVMRVKLRRQVRNIVRNNHIFENSFDIVIIIRKNFLSNDHQTNFNSFAKLIKPILSK